MNISKSVLCLGEEEKINKKTEKKGKIRKIS